MQILTDCFIELDGVAYSGQGTNVAISYGAEAKDQTTFGKDTQKNAGGVKQWSMEMEFLQDEGVSGQAFFDMVGTEIPVEVRPTSAARSASNPGYVGTALVTDYTPLGGSHGDNSTVSLSLVSAGDLTREEA